MAYIKKNVSITFLFFIIASLIVLTGTTIYYQTTLTKINEDYTSKIQALATLEGQAQEITSTLNKAMGDRQLSLARGSKFATTYTELKNLQEQTEARRNRLQQERDIIESNLLQSKREYLSASQQEKTIDDQNKALRIQQDQLVELKARREGDLRAEKRKLDKVLNDIATKKTELEEETQ